MSPARHERPARSTSRFAGVSRMGLRVVVLVGFAGAAWAMSASAANAAADPGTPDQSTTSTAGTSAQPLTALVGGTLHDLLESSPSSRSSSGSVTDTVLTPLDNAVTTTAKPLLDAGTSVLGQVLAPTNTVLQLHGSVAVPVTTPHHVVSVAPVRHSSEAAPGPVTIQVNAPQSAGPNGAPGKEAPRVGSQDLVRTVTSLVAPLGLDQLVQEPLDLLQPMIGIADPILTPLDSVLSPFTATVRTITAPVFDPLGPAVQPVTDVVMRSTAGSAKTVPATVIVDANAGAPVPSAGTVSETTTAPVTPVRVEAVPAGSKATSSVGTRGTPSHHRPQAITVDRSGTPGSPAPLPVPPAGVLGGISTMGSGSHEDNAGFAVLSCPVVNGSAGEHRLPTATGIAVRRQNVESPTVSPD